MRNLQVLVRCRDKFAQKSGFPNGLPEILRGLIETIKVRNTDDGIEIELIGEIVNMIDLAQTAAHKGTAASQEAAVPDVYRSSVKVVAGACNQRYLHIAEGWLPRVS